MSSRSKDFDSAHTDTSHITQMSHGLMLLDTGIGCNCSYCPAKIQPKTKSRWETFVLVTTESFNCLSFPLPYFSLQSFPRIFSYRVMLFFMHTIWFCIVSETFPFLFFRSDPEQMQGFLRQNNSAAWGPSGHSLI